MKESKFRLNSGNACCYAIRELFSYWLLFTDVKIKMRRRITLLCVSLKHRLWVFDNNNSGDENICMSERGAS
jgi:hypothetical protein